MNRLASIDIRKMQWKVNISVLPQKKKNRSNEGYNNFVNF